MDADKNQSCAALFDEIMPIARNLIEQARLPSASGTTIGAQIRSMLTGVQTDHAVTTVLGALASAVVDLERDQLRGVLPADASKEFLAEQLIRLAYNRWQCERRSEIKISEATRRGSHRNGDFEVDFLANGIAYRDGLPNRAEIVAQIRELFDKLVEAFTPQDMKILFMYAEGHSIDEIAQASNRHRTTVSRKLDRLADLVKRRWNENE